MSAELGWTPSKTELELQQVNDRFLIVNTDKTSPSADPNIGSVSKFV
jgi:hypothetical protein